MRHTRTVIWGLLLLLALFPPVLRGEEPGRVPLHEEFAKQKRIYGDKEEFFRDGYVVDRSFAMYALTLASGFDGDVARLGPDQRWLDIGAGQGKAVLDYYGWRFDLMHDKVRKRDAKKARAVAISIEDRRTPAWEETAATLEPGQMRYLCNKRFGEYEAEELGGFQVISDVFGAFSYTDNLSRFMERALAVLQPNGSLYTVLQDVHLHDSSNRPYYPDSSYLTEIENTDGSELPVCEWLKSIKCVEVACEAKTAWKPPIEAYSVRKVCSDIKVPKLTLMGFEAGTPPVRRFRISGNEHLTKPGSGTSLPVAAPR
jgi:hypothetical protein